MSNKDVPQDDEEVPPDTGTPDEEKAKTGKQEREIPARWKELPLADLVDKGWMPRVKKTRGIEYLSLRRGNNEHQLGPYTPERLELLLEMFPQLRDGPPIPRSPNPSTPNLLTASLAKPAPLKGPIEASLEVLDWYRWAQTRDGIKFDGSLSEFINEVVLNYFHEHGFEYEVLIRKGELNGN